MGAVTTSQRSMKGKQQGEQQEQLWAAGNVKARNTATGIDICYLSVPLEA